MTTDTDVYKTTQRNARGAGFVFLFYIAVGIQRAPAAGIDALFNILMCFSAVVLGVTLYAITRDQDRDLAMLGLVCRVAEGVVGAMFNAGMSKPVRRAHLATHENRRPHLFRLSNVIKVFQAQNI